MLELIFQKIVNFFGIHRFFQILNEGDDHQFLTYHGITSIIAPITPLLMACEFILGLVYKKTQTKICQVLFLIDVFNRIVGRFIAIAMVTICIGLLEPWAIINTSNTWYWFIYSYIIWDIKFTYSGACMPHIIHQKE
ncbi:MAG: hypothetical protein OXE77_11595 [Flavobacteriaceae bacterium]|nr:hypothetical protein [Flavobacteriaceae bacterium]MCY4266491.1 hypothetical protein [Flavobacteriaceae bacterium]